MPTQPGLVWGLTGGPCSPALVQNQFFLRRASNTFGQANSQQFWSLRKQGFSAGWGFWAGNESAYQDIWFDTKNQTGAFAPAEGFCVPVLHFSGKRVYRACPVEFTPVTPFACTAGMSVHRMCLKEPTGLKRDFCNCYSYRALRQEPELLVEYEGGK